MLLLVLVSLLGLCQSVRRAVCVSPTQDPRTLVQFELEVHYQHLHLHAVCRPTLYGELRRCLSIRKRTSVASGGEVTVGSVNLPTGVVSVVALFELQNGAFSTTKGTHTHFSKEICE